jgi:hypothetical protein
LKEYRRNSDEFSVAYHRETTTRIPARVEEEIEKELRKKVHDREVITTAIGALIQHDGSHHRWSPYARDKWVLITSLDDFSRKLLYADL